MSGPWRGAVIAAGHGERLRRGGLSGSKAMAMIGGRPLIEHALERFRAAGVEQVSVILNEDSHDARDQVATMAIRLGLALDLVVKTTPSSFASFDLLSRRLAGAPTLISTVDAVMPVRDFVAFLSAVERMKTGAVVLGVTTHVDDEKPLWAELDPVDAKIRRLGGGRAAHVTAGLYALPARRPRLGERRFERLRDYLGWLVASGQPVYGVDLPTVFDVDRPGDVEEAERALAAWSRAGEQAWV